MNQGVGRIGSADRAFAATPSSPQAVSPVPASIPCAVPKAIAHDGITRCLEQAWDECQYVGCDFAQWAKTHNIPLHKILADAEHVKLSRSSKVAPDICGGEGK